MHFDLAIDISRPRDVVFAYASDVERVPQWAAPALLREKITPGPVGVGTRYRAVDKLPLGRVEFTEEITRWQPAERVGVRMQAPFNADIDLHLHPTDDGTRLALSIDMQPNGLMGLLAPLLRAPIRAMFAKDLDSMRQILEAQDDPTAATG